MTYGIASYDRGLIRAARSTPHRFKWVAVLAMLEDLKRDFDTKKELKKEVLETCLIEDSTGKKYDISPATFERAYKEL